METTAAKQFELVAIFDKVFDQTVVPVGNLIFRYFAIDGDGLDDVLSDDFLLAKRSGPKA